MTANSFGARDRLGVGDTTYEVFRLDRVDGSARLPYSLKVLLENLLRNAGWAPTPVLNRTPSNATGTAPHGSRLALPRARLASGFPLSLRHERIGVGPTAAFGDTAEPASLTMPHATGKQRRTARRT
jgi:hypothetical protein